MANRHPCEILGLGQQWLMEGEHPSGTHYSWVDGIRPVDMGWENIPQVTLDQVNAFRAKLRERLIEAGLTPAKGKLGTGPAAARRASATRSARTIPASRPTWRCSSARSPRCRATATSWRITTTG